ncbi:MAG: hypothetical protein FWG87_00130 [Defluviitaleaceae bacterium]|nr:hypothetical protein [Defluviitaleaceae bacterium]
MPKAKPFPIMTENGNKRLSRLNFRQPLVTSRTTSRAVASWQIKKATIEWRLIP